MYDPRYLAGVQLFNEGDFFEAHEVWEDLWAECYGAERKFVQGLIQAAVGLCHFGNGNTRGGRKLYHSARDYMVSAGDRIWGCDIVSFWEKMQICFSPILTEEEWPRGELDASLVPEIKLDPEPEEWPDPEEYVHDE